MVTKFSQVNWQKLYEEHEENLNSDTVSKVFNMGHIIVTNF